MQFVQITPWAALLLVAHYALALALLWTCICRATHTTKTRTKPGIRWAFNILAVVAVLAILAPLLPEYTRWAWLPGPVRGPGRWMPDLMDVLLLGAIVFAQITTARHWRAGVPEQFQTDSARAELARADGSKVDL
jgi:hypothetical protein